MSKVTKSKKTKYKKARQKITKPGVAIPGVNKPGVAKSKEAMPVKAMPTKAMRKVNLRLDIKSFWHAGTGLSAGSQSDALCEKGADGLPVVSGRQLKGLLRHAIHRAERWGWFENTAFPAGPAKDIETLMFGSRSQQESRDSTLPGVLRVGDATLGGEEGKWLAHKANATYRQALFTELFSTAINESGTARNQSLRSMEVARPLLLQAQITAGVAANFTALQVQQEQWLEQGDLWQVLAGVLCLVDGLGAGRTRGFGEAELILEPLAEEEAA